MCEMKAHVTNAKNISIQLENSAHTHTNICTSERDERKSENKDFQVIKFVLHV